MVRGAAEDRRRDSERGEELEREAERDKSA